MKRNFYIVSMIGVFSCTSISSRVNDSDDINRADAVIGKFYSLVGAGKFEEASNLSGGALSPTSLHNILLKADSLWGNLKTYELEYAATNVATTNGKTEGVYNLKYKTTYERSNHNEESVVMRLFGDTLKITGYHAEMDY